MEQMVKKIFSILLLISTGALLADCTSCDNGCNSPGKPVTCFVPRSQSFHNELKNAVMDPDQQFLYDVGFNGSFNLMFEYNQTFNDKTLTQCLFGPAAVCIQNTTNCCNDDDDLVIRIVGTKASTVAGASNPNGITDLVADNFFLPKDFMSTITIKPSIENFNIHLQAYFGFDEWCTGLYARIYAPITVSRWKLETCESIDNRGIIGFVAGEIAPVAVPVTDLYTSFLQFVEGTALTLPGSTTPSVLPGPTVEALTFTRFGKCETDTTTQLADLRFELGRNFLLDEDYHLGLYIAAAAPTANDCKDDCKGLLWGAKAGNGKHWELGGGLTAHYTLCRSEDCEQQLDLFVDVTVTHMFKHSELRTFDLKNKPLSRYIIAEQLASPVTNGLNLAGAPPVKFQFASNFAPVANFSTVPVSVSFPVQADVMAKFVYTCHGFSWALGYDFWAQTCPSVELDCDECNANQFPANTWALRGDAHVFAFANNLDFGTNQGIQPIPATFNNTTAFNIGTAFESGTPANSNCGIDNSAGGARIVGPAANLFAAPGSLTNPICISNPPIFIQQSDLDICNITRGMSNSLFTELNYTWLECKCWVPYLGIGARVEFGNNTDNDNNMNNVNATPINATTTNNCCDNCGTCTASVWGVWIRGGASFN